MGIKSSFIVQTAPALVVRTQATPARTALVPVDRTTGVATDYITITNPTAAAVNSVTITGALGTYETARSVSELSNSGSVTGGSYPDTGATSQTLSFPAKSQVILAVAHTFDLTPNDNAGRTLKAATSTPVYTITDGVGTYPQVVPGATFITGAEANDPTLSLLFDPRAKNSPQMWSALTDMEPGDLSEFLDWLEAGNNLHDIVKAVKANDGYKAGFYGTTPIAQQTGVAVSAAGVHAALVALGLITA